MPRSSVYKMHQNLITFGIRLALCERVMKTIFRGIFCLLMLLLTYRVGWADAPALSSSRSLLGYLDPRTWPFIPVPEVGTDPNGGTTVGILPVFLFVDEHQQVNRIVNGDLTYNSTLGIGGSLQILSYLSEQWFGQKSGGNSTVRPEFIITGLIFYPRRVES